MSSDSFKIRYSELNTTNLQDLNSDIKVIDKNNVFNKSISVSITSSQINNLSTTPVLICDDVIETDIDLLKTLFLSITLISEFKSCKFVVFNSEYRILKESDDI